MALDRRNGRRAKDGRGVIEIEQASELIRITAGPEEFERDARVLGQNADVFGEIRRGLGGEFDEADELPTGEDLERGEEVGDDLAAIDGGMSDAPGWDSADGIVADMGEFAKDRDVGMKVAAIGACFEFSGESAVEEDGTQEGEAVVVKVVDAATAVGVVDVIEGDAEARVDETRHDDFAGGVDFERVASLLEIFDATRGADAKDDVVANEDGTVFNHGQISKLITPA